MSDHGLWLGDQPRSEAIICLINLKSAGVNAVLCLINLKSAGVNIEGSNLCCYIAIAISIYRD